MLKNMLMTNDETYERTLQLIKRDFEIDEAAAISETDLLQLLADRIDWFMSHRMEWLLSLLYQLDVAEENVNAALHPAAPEPANVGLARLVLDRQKQRVHTKMTYRTPDVDEDMAW